MTLDVAGRPCEAREIDAKGLAPAVSSDLDRVATRVFGPGESNQRTLRARIGALLRRSALRARRGRLRVGALEVDPAARTAHLNGRAVPLSQKEFGLLRVLASDPIRVFTKEELLRQVWGYRSIGSTRTLDSHACRLRRKLARDGDAFVVNVWGVGYRLCDAPAAS